MYVTVYYGRLHHIIVYLVPSFFSEWLHHNNDVDIRTALLAGESEDSVPMEFLKREACIKGLGPCSLEQFGCKLCRETLNPKLYPKPY